MVAEFEARFAQAVGARFAVAVSSGTAALDLAYRALLKPGDEVIVPDFTFVATASMVVAAGAKPVFADVDPETFTLDPADVERRITSRTCALAPVHLYGQPADIAPLARLARRHHLKLIWDAAQAHGARFQQHDVGSFADVVCYSFYPTKNMTTGEGGMLTTPDERLATEIRLLRSHGEEGRYLHVRLGFNLRMTDIAGALGLSQLAKLPAALERRRKNATILTQGLTGIPGIKPPSVRAGYEHAFSLYTVQLDPKVLGMTRDEFQRAMADRGVETAVHYPRPLHRQPIFRRHGTDRDYPVSSRLAETVISLPVHPGLSPRDVRRIVRVVREVAELARG
jgi:perosamine synthetase